MWNGTNGTIDGNKIIITCDSDYKYVRYAWKPNTVKSDDISSANLYNSSNLPAFPFTASVKQATGASAAVIDRDSVRISVSVPSYDELIKNAVLMIARYDNNNALIGTEIKDLRLVLNDDTEYLYTTATEGAATIKAIVFENLTNIKPLAVQEGE